MTPEKRMEEFMNLFAQLNQEEQLIFLEDLRRHAAEKEKIPAPAV